MILTYCVDDLVEVEEHSCVTVCTTNEPKPVTKSSYDTLKEEKGERGGGKGRRGEEEKRGEEGRGGGERRRREGRWGEGRNGERTEGRGGGEGREKWREEGEGVRWGDGMSDEGSVRRKGWGKVKGGGS